MNVFRPALILGLAALAAPLRAQCPDGTAPPCARPKQATAAPAASTAKLNVAVLYFQNASRDTTSSYLADGLTESLIDRLAQSGLTVASRYQVLRLRNERIDPSQLSRTLNASHLLTGALRTSGNSLRVTVELVRLPNGDRVWGRQFDRRVEDVLALETEIANIVADSVSGRLQPRQRAALATGPTLSPKAYDHYQRGRFYVAQRTAPSIRRAIREFEEAVETDPRSSRLHAELALAYATCLTRGPCWEAAPGGADTLFARGFSSVERSLQLDSTNAAAWSARAILLRSQLIQHPSRDFSTPVRAALRAIALDSTLGEAWQAYGHVVLYTGADSVADAALRRTLALEPDRAGTIEHLSRIAFYRRDYRHTIALIDSAKRADPGYNVPELEERRALALLQLGDVAGARQAVNRAGQRPNAAIIFVLMAEGDTVRAQALADSLPIDPLSQLAAGRKNRALELLERRPPSIAVHSLLRIPAFDAIRGDPRFQRVELASRPVPIR